MAALSLPTGARPPETRPVTGAVKITIKEFEDERALVREPLSERIRVVWSPHILMQLKLEGEPLLNAYRMSDPQIVEAADDLGNSLLFSAEDLQRDWAHPVDSRGNPLSIHVPQMWGSSTQPTSEDMPAISQFGRDKGAMVETYVRLKSPVRRATKIASFRASIRVMTGQRRQLIEFPNLPTSIDHAIVHPVLKQAGLHIEFLRRPEISGDPPLTSFALKVAGDMAQIRDVAIYEGGNDVSHGNGGPNEDEWPVFLSHSLTPAMVLRLDVVYSQKLTTVPLELRDVRLP